MSTARLWIRLRLSNDEAYDLVMSIATGEFDDVPSIAAVLECRCAPTTS